MANVLRISEENTPENLLRHRAAKMESVLQKAERILRLGEARLIQGNPMAARILKKRARHAARHAMSLMGILMIEYGINVAAPAERAKTIVLATRNGS